MAESPTADPLARLGKGVVVVVFGAPWCIPARLMQPLLEELRTSGADVRYVDIEEFPQHAESFRVISLPTVVRLTAGSEKRRLIGAVGKSDLARLAK